MKTCPFCAEQIQDAAIVCKHCGRDLKPLTTAAKPGGKGRVLLWSFLGFLGLLVIVALQSEPGQRSPGSELRSRRNPTEAQLARYVESADFSCPTATRKFHQANTETGEIWNVECSTGQSYAVTLENAGQIKVSSCAVLERASRIDCFRNMEDMK